MMNLSTPLFKGSLVRLTALRPDDLPSLVRWYEDSDFSRRFDALTAFPRTEEQIRSYYLHDNRSNTSYGFGIRTLYDDLLLGVTDLDGIQWNNRVGWLAIAIGEPVNRGRGYGKDAMRLMLRFAFRELNLNRVQLTVFSYNAPAIHLYESLGFTHEGTYREAILREGEAHDILLYGLLAREWSADQ